MKPGNSSIDELRCSYRRLCSRKLRQFYNRRCLMTGVSWWHNSNRWKKFLRIICILNAPKGSIEPKLDYNYTIADWRIQFSNNKFQTKIIYLSIGIWYLKIYWFQNTFICYQKIFETLDAGYKIMSYSSTTIHLFYKYTNH